MFFDIPEERGLSEADIRWGDPDECRFPLFDFLQPLPLHWMCIVYLIMWIGKLRKKKLKYCSLDFFHNLFNITLWTA